MKRSVWVYAAALGAVFALLVFLSNVTFADPTTSDDAYTGLILGGYLVLFVLFAVGGVIASDAHAPVRSGALGGAVSGLIMVGMIMGAFAVVDNVFLSVVSQQVDKISAFHNQHTYTSMRAFINSGLLLGTLVVLPVVALGGGVLGALGSLLRRRIVPTQPASA
jgi:hypothetical protein